MKIRIAGLVNDSIVDGPGFRFSVFTQGCPHHCPGCHNPQTHDFNGGKDMETEEIVRQFSQNPLLDGITLSGGEPFCQCDACAELAGAAKKLGLNVWAYSGYSFVRDSVVMPRQWVSFSGTPLPTASSPASTARTLAWAMCMAESE